MLCALYYFLAGDSAFPISDVLIKPFSQEIFSFDVLMKLGLTL